MAFQLPFDSSRVFYSLDVELEEREYHFDVRFNGRDGAWYFDVSTGEGVWLRHGVKIVLGIALCGRVSHEDRWPGMLMAFDQSGQGLDADAAALGARVIVVYFTADEVIEAAT